MKKRLDLDKEAFEKILEVYTIGTYKNHERHWWSISNTIYVLMTTRGKFIVKIFGEPDTNYTRWTLQVMETLRKRGLPIPQTYATKKKAFLYHAQDYYLVIQEFIEGTPITHADNRFVKEFASTLAKLDRNLLKIKRTGKHVWGKWGHQFRPAHYRSTDIIDGFDFDAADKKLIAELKENVDREELRKSVIHADYQLNNLIVDKGKIKAVLDWSDMHEDFLAFEVAIALNHFFIVERKAPLTSLPDFFKAYERILPLNREEKKAIYFFIKNRLLSGIVWCDLHRKDHPDKAEKLTGWLHGTILSYKSFDTLTLTEFLKLIAR